MHSKIPQEKPKKKIKNTRPMNFFDEMDKVRRTENRTVPVMPDYRGGSMRCGK